MYIHIYMRLRVCGSGLDFAFEGLGLEVQQIPHAGILALPSNHSILLSTQKQT